MLATEAELDEEGDVDEQEKSKPATSCANVGR